MRQGNDIRSSIPIEDKKDYLDIRYVLDNHGRWIKQVEPFFRNLRGDREKIARVVGYQPTGD